MNDSKLRTIALYLPQYHPVPENNEWWGKGFTEWTNVTKCRPGFSGQYQPHLPADLGFCDLRVPETRCAQAELAAAYGISGFCYYHYWFNGRRILERPFNEVLASGEPNFPFCLCWANENWTRAWDGNDREILLEQRYSDEDDRTHLRSLAPAFADPRYIRVSGRPMFLVYRAAALKDAKRTTDTWRDEAHRLGPLASCTFVELRSFSSDRSPPQELGFDAAVEFAPDWNCVGEPLGRGLGSRLLRRITSAKSFMLDNRVCSYDTLVRNMLAKPNPGYNRYRCVTPMWDNTARRGKDALVLVGSTPEKYGSWLQHVANQARSESNEPIVFVNAWNEWAEGNHLEPCQKWGTAYLDATLEALGQHT